jgi:small subunit ribosomal protein S21
MAGKQEITMSEAEVKLVETKGPPELEPDAFTPLQVVVGSNFEDALKRFKSLVQKSKILSLYKEKQSYEKPSEKKRRRNREAQERNRVAALREKQILSGEWEQRQKSKEQKRRERTKENDRRPRERNEDE